MKSRNSTHQWQSINDEEQEFQDLNLWFQIHSSMQSKQPINEKLQKTFHNLLNLRTKNR